jgi:hypothetical protein
MSKSKYFCFVVAFLMMFLFSACGHKGNTYTQINDDSDDSHHNGNLNGVLDLTAIFCATFGCDDTDTQTADVYVAGYYYDGSNDIAALWKNDTKTDLPANAGQNSYAKAVYVSGGSVYVAGAYQSGSNYIPAVWKDGVKLYDLPVIGGGDATSIYIDSGNVYVAGNYWDGTSSNRPPAVYWLNAARTDLPSGNIDAAAMSIYVSNGHIYVAGFYWTGGSDFVATVWIDGVKTDLNAGGNHAAFANSIFVSGGSVYIAGYYNTGSYDIAAVWVDSVKTDLSTTGHNARANSIYLSGGNVYVGGSYDYGAVVWENGVIANLPCTASSSTSANSVYVSSNVYLAGNDYDNNNGNVVATVWKDGAKLYSLSAPVTGNSSYANSIYVQDK